MKLIYNINFRQFIDELGDEVNEGWLSIEATNSDLAIELAEITLGRLGVEFDIVACEGKVLDV
jgi:hypothetical protein